MSSHRATRWQHPALQPGWIDRPYQVMQFGDLPLESGEVIRDFEISYVTHGTRAPGDDNVVLVLTAIGSTHHRLDFLIGPDRPLDTERYFVVCVDAIGNGLTTSPSNSRQFRSRRCRRHLAATRRHQNRHCQILRRARRLSSAEAATDTSAGAS